MAANDVLLDEIQWYDLELAASIQGIHSNSVLPYFAESPFFDKTSNNAVILNQALYNPSMFQYVTTREAFEGRLKTMSGLEYVVAQAPSEMAPGTGTGVWVIRKQTRRKKDKQEDEITVHASYYVVGERIYMAPTLADILSFRLTIAASSLRKCFPAADEVRTWSPALGHLYKLPTTTTNPRERTLASKEATPMPENGSQSSKESLEAKKSGNSIDPDSRLAEQSFAIHMQYGGEYMDENPITGKPGEFHLSSTGRKDKTLQLPGLNPLTIKTPVAPPGGVKKEASGKGDKTPKTPKTPTSGSGKPKRKKSKSGQTPNPS